MKITAVITAQMPAQRGRVSVCAGIRIARHQEWPDKQSPLLRFVSSSSNRIMLDSHLRSVESHALSNIAKTAYVVISAEAGIQNSSESWIPARATPDCDPGLAGMTFEILPDLRATSPRSTNFQCFRIGT